MSVTADQVRKIATLANLKLTEAEIDKFTTQLSEVIDYNVSKLNEVNTDEVEPLLNVAAITNTLREDETSPSLEQKDALRNTTGAHNGLFKVKRILD